MAEVLAGQICMFCGRSASPCASAAPLKSAAEDGNHSPKCPYFRAAQTCCSITARYADGGVAMLGARAAIYEDEQERRGARA